MARRRIQKLPHVSKPVLHVLPHDALPHAVRQTVASWAWLDGTTLRDQLCTKMPTLQCTPFVRRAFMEAPTGVNALKSAGMGSQQLRAWKLFLMLTCQPLSRSQARNGRELPLHIRKPAEHHPPLRPNVPSTATTRKPAQTGRVFSCGTESPHEHGRQSQPALSDPGRCRKYN